MLNKDINHCDEDNIYAFTGEYRFLSNFYSNPVLYEGILYPSAENAYQASKCKNYTERLKFVDVSPAFAKKLGRSVEMKPDFEENKVKIMQDIIRCKFDQYDSLKFWLCTTGNKKLYEGNDWDDKFWGVDFNTKEGENILGKLLMNLRSIYLEKGSLARLIEQKQISTDDDGEPVLRDMGLLKENPIDDLLEIIDYYLLFLRSPEEINEIRERIKANRLSRKPS